MRKWRKNEPDIEKDDNEQFLEAILGPDGNVTDEEALKILALYGLSEIELLEDLKTSVRERLRGQDPKSDEVKKLGAMLMNIADFQKEVSGERLSPKQRLSQLFGGGLTSGPRFAFSFHNREEGDLPDSDQDILDELKAELTENEDDSGL